jgi:hypothetical protein
MQGLGTSATPDKLSHKPQFSYCKIEYLEALKTLLKSQGISLSPDKAIGQEGQCQTKNYTWTKNLKIQALIT